MKSFFFKFWLFVLFVLSIAAPLQAYPIGEPLHNSRLVDSLYARHGGQLLWFAKGNWMKRNSFMSLILQSRDIGLVKEHYHYDTLVAAMATHGSVEMDRLYTDAAVSFYKDIYLGNGVTKLLGTDQVSPKHIAANEQFIVEKLSKSIGSEQDLIFLVESLQPATEEYKMLKTELGYQIRQENQQKIKQLSKAMNFYRWINHFRFEKYIVVNAGSALLKYYEKGSKKLEMNVVVGKPATKTPQFATYLNEVILYPYWNVPRSIAVNEILPKVKRDRAILQTMDMQVINAAGVVVDPDTIKWASMTKNHFPYRFRQSTGCDNALGVMKFNLTSPYAIYLHDTDVKSVFKTKRRYFSHGCVRLEKPMDLARLLLPGQIDERLLEACVKDQKPIVKPLKDHIPVFIIYSTVEVLDTVGYFPDTYNLEL